MRFRYDSEKCSVIDDESGISIFVKGRPEVGLEPFVLHDPRDKKKRSFHGEGMFRFDAEILQHHERIEKEDGTVWTHDYVDGYRLHLRTLVTTFLSYTQRDRVAFEKLLEFIKAGLSEYLRHQGVSAPIILIE